MELSRRTFLLGASAAMGTALPAGRSLAQSLRDTSAYHRVYAPVDDDLYPIPGVELSRINPAYLRRVVPYETAEAPGTIVVDPQSRYLYLVMRDGMAVRYGVGVGRSGFSWSGSATVKDKQEWPDWYPPKEMFGRQPELMEQMGELPGGPGMPGGPGNPLGARALYLWQGNRDTLYRIHGTFEPWTIGTHVSSGCIRMINQDVIDLYNHTPTGTKVVVLSSPNGRPRRNQTASRT
ncbi:lipoprotein-anchoring transpeptidase ErfK/SrfK [Microvirga flocculans]|uniref:Lipoprotein-anchoring transpeptidase ErfK/SrfK n=1 Tax=Microvirga flocculans TaxID=217168 RepID=A0A7W6II83_9HYPH|nr:L,D-transpeptidase [Microvirga flocculans]MBB4041975.1 lipoprotein-anchoring transpeptidase ErfK/SrfK [Microvirga flocculans]